MQSYCKSSTRLLVLLFLSLFVLFSIQTAEANYLEKFTIAPHENDYVKISLEPDDKATVILSGNKSFDLYILNQSQIGDYWASGILPSSTPYANKKEVEIQIAGKGFFEDLNATAFLTASGDKINVYLLIINLGDEFLEVRRFDQNGFFDSKLMVDIFLATKFATMGLYGAVSLILIHHYFKLKKREEELQAKTTLGFGIGYFSAFLLNIVAEVENYWEWQTGETYVQIGAVALPTKILFYVISLQNEIYIMLLALTFGFIAYVVEINVTLRKRSYLAWNIFFATCMTFLIFVFPNLVLPILLYFLFSLVIAFIQVIYLYGKIASQSSGAIRKKALFLIFGIALPIFSFIGRTLVFQADSNLYYTLFNIGAMLGLYCCYKGNS